MSTFLNQENHAIANKDVLNEFDKLRKPLTVTSTAIRFFLPRGPESNDEGRVQTGEDAIQVTREATVWKLLLFLGQGTNFYGVTVGPLSTRSHDVSGDVYIVDEHRIRIKHFVYDGQGPGNYFIKTVLWSANVVMRDRKFTCKNNCKLFYMYMFLLFVHTWPWPWINPHPSGCIGP